MFLVIFEQQKLAHVNMEKALDKDEVFWKKIKFKVAWHVDGERNTKYFHEIPKIKNTSKLIGSIKDGDTVLVGLEHVSQIKLQIT